MTLVRHHTNLNYTGLRKIVKKFLKKTCQAIAASDAENGDDALRDELTALLDIIPITNRPPHALSALATDEDAGPHGVGSGDEPDSVDGSDAAARSRVPRATSRRPPSAPTIAAREATSPSPRVPTGTCTKPPRRRRSPKFALACVRFRSPEARNSRVWRRISSARTPRRCV